MIVKNIFWNWGFTSRQYALSELLKLSTWASSYFCLYVVEDGVHGITVFDSRQHNVDQQFVQFQSRRSLQKNVTMMMIDIALKWHVHCKLSDNLQNF